MILSAVMYSGTSRAECRAVGAQELREYLASDTGVKELVFFAAWCKDCKGKLESAGRSQAVVAVFEEKERAEKIWRAVNLKKSPCFYDRDESVAKAWGVIGLPFSAPVSR